MKISKQFVIAVVISACILAAGFTYGLSRRQSMEGEGHYVWNVALNLSESTLNYQFYENFKEIIEEESNGDIQVNLYPNGQLGGDAEQLMGLIDGTIDFSTTITSSMTSTIPEYGIFDLPNAFQNVEMMREVEDNAELLAALNEASSQKGIYLMGIADAGFRELSTNVEAHNPQEMKGTKIRVMDNPYHQAYWNALGLATTSMDFNEVYSSLQQKVIDAEENPYMNICANNFYEVQDYIIETNHLGHIMVFTMNLDLYNNLLPEIQELVNNSAKQALDITREAADDSIEEYKQTIEKSGTKIVEMEPEVLEEMRGMAEPVYDMARKDLGDALVEVFTDACTDAKIKLGLQ